MAAANALGVGCFMVQGPPPPVLPAAVLHSNITNPNEKKGEVEFLKLVFRALCLCWDKITQDLHIDWIMFRGHPLWVAERKKGGRGTTWKGMDMSFMPRQRARLMPTRRCMKMIFDINLVAAFEWWEGYVHSILSVLAYPCAWSWKQWRRRRKIHRLQEYVNLNMTIHVFALADHGLYIKGRRQQDNMVSTNFSWASTSAARTVDEAMFAIITEIPAGYYDEALRGDGGCCFLHLVLLGNDEGLQGEGSTAPFSSDMLLSTP